MFLNKVINSVSGGKKNNDIVTLGLGALVIGGAAAFILNKVAGVNINGIVNNAINRMSTAHANAATAIGTNTGTMMGYSRGFPDRSILFNSLPSPSVEHLVGYDATGRYANITGAYDKCDGYDPYF